MLPSKFYKHFGIRINLTPKLAGATYYLWDPKSEQLISAPPYLVFGMYAGLYGGTSLVFMHLARIYIKTTFVDIPEEGLSGNESSLSLRDFATLIFEGGEIMLIICCAFLNYTFLHRIDIFKHLFNQLLNYNKHLTRLVEEGQLVLTPSQRRVSKVSTALLYIVMIFMTLLPGGMFGAVSNKIEPHHQMIVEWLEIPFELSWGTFPLLLLMFAALYGVSTTIGLMCMVICLYFTTTTICTEALTPTQMVSRPTDGPGRSKIQTGGFGQISDLDVIQLYRTQQIFNVLLSSFFRSVLISFHHTGLLAAIVAFLVFVVKYNEILSSIGPVAYLVVFSCMSALVLVIYCQCQMGGAVVDISKAFKYSGRKLFGRKALFRKFSRSCTTFYIEVTYPFYTIHKETFTRFLEQVLDYSIELLLW